MGISAHSVDELETYLPALVDETKAGRDSTCINRSPIKMLDRGGTTGRIWTWLRWPSTIYCSKRQTTTTGSLAFPSTALFSPLVTCCKRFLTQITTATLRWLLESSELGRTDLFVFCGFAHDPQRVLAAVHPFAFVGIELCLDIGVFELSVAPLADADSRRGLLYNPQLAFRHVQSLAHREGLA